LRELTERGEVLDRCLWTLVGSAEDVRTALADYVALGVTRFILSDTPYREEAIRVGTQVVQPMLAAATAR
jgi:alkanesulfonate monooxygenase